VSIETLSAVTTFAASAVVALVFHAVLQWVDMQQFRKEHKRLRERVNDLSVLVAGVRRKKR